MVALNPAYSPAAGPNEPQNRVGDFLGSSADCTRSERLPAQQIRWENECHDYDTASGSIIILYADPSGLASALSHATKGGRNVVPGTGFEYSDEFFGVMAIPFSVASLAPPRRPAFIPAAVLTGISAELKNQQGDSVGANATASGAVGDILSAVPGVVGAGGIVLSATGDILTVADIATQVIGTPTPQERNANRANRLNALSRLPKRSIEPTNTSLFENSLTNSPFNSEAKSSFK